MSRKLYKLRYKDTRNNIEIEDSVEAEDCITALQKGLLFSKRYGLLLLRVELMFSYRERKAKENTLLTYTRT